MHPMKLLPLGDQAVMAYCDNEEAAARLAQRARRADFAWALDVVQAYTTVALFYDLRHIDFPRAAAELQGVSTGGVAGEMVGRQVTIPCCYELGLDIAR